MLRSRRSTPSGWAATASSAWREPRRSAPAAGRSARNAGACVQCSSCPLGCRIDAKRAVHVSYLPRAVAAGRPGARRGQGRSGCCTEGGRATGLACRAGLPTTAAEEAARERPPDTAAGHCAGPRRRCGGDQRRRRLRHPGAAAALGDRPTPTSGATCTSTPPPGSAPATRRRCAAGRGSCRATTSTSGQPQGILLEATFTPLSFGAQWLPGVGAEFAERVRHFDHVASIGVHLHDRLRGPGRPHLERLACGSPTGSRDEEARRIQFGIARAAEIHFAAGATEVYPNVGPVPVIRAGVSRSSRRSTLKPCRPATRGLPPDEHRPDGGRSRRPASPTPTAPCAAPTASTSPTPACCRPRSGSTR